jgi:hypothetical protein
MRKGETFATYNPVATDVVPSRAWDCGPTVS